MFRLCVFIYCIFLASRQSVSSDVPQNANKGIPAIDSDFLFLTINKSTLPFRRAGLGVFSKETIYANEIICEYRGAVIPSNVPFKSDYIYSTRNPAGHLIHIIPDMDKPICAFINDCVKVLGSNYTAAELDVYESGTMELPTYDGFHHNAATLFTDLGKVFIVSTQDIPARTEIFYPYGSGYWVPRLRIPAAFGMDLSSVDF